MEAAKGTILVVAAVVRSRGRYLVCQRPTAKEHGGLWEFPGGKVEAGESAEQAIARELAEELNIAMEQVGEKPHQAQEQGSRYLIEFYEVMIVGEPHCREHTACVWLTPEELRHTDLAPSDRHFVENHFLAEV